MKNDIAVCAVALLGVSASGRYAVIVNISCKMTRKGPVFD